MMPDPLVMRRRPPLHLVLATGRVAVPVRSCMMVPQQHGTAAMPPVAATGDLAAMQRASRRVRSPALDVRGPAMPVRRPPRVRRPVRCAGRTVMGTPAAVYIDPAMRRTGRRHWRRGRRDGVRPGLRQGIGQAWSGRWLQPRRLHGRRNLLRRQWLRSRGRRDDRQCSGHAREAGTMNQGLQHPADAHQRLK